MSIMATNIATTITIVSARRPYQFLVAVVDDQYVIGAHKEEAKKP